MKKPHNLSIVKSFRMSRDSVVLLEVMRLRTKKKLRYLMDDIIKESYEKYVNDTVSSRKLERLKKIDEDFAERAE